MHYMDTDKLLNLCQTLVLLWLKNGNNTKLKDLFKD